LGFDLLQESNFKRFVEVGRGASIIHSLCITKTDLSHQLVVLLKAGPYAGKIAVIAEIIDHNRVCRTFHPTFSVLIPPQALIDGPTTSVPRQPFPYRHLSLTPLALTKLPRAASSGVIKKQLEKEGTIEKWDRSAWAQKRAHVEKRRSLNDFERFGVMLAKKARRDTVRRSLAKARKA